MERYTIDEIKSMLDGCEECKIAQSEWELSHLFLGPDHIRELLRAEEEGRLVVLPCKVGDVVYSTLDDLGRLHRCKVRRISIERDERESYVEFEPIDYRGQRYGASFGAFGKTVFLTREKAEAVLKGGSADA